jgi:hypothetical protein
MSGGGVWGGVPEIVDLNVFAMAHGLKTFGGLRGVRLGGLILWGRSFY